MKEQSLFEFILSTPINERNESVLEYLWNEFELWKTPEVFTMVI